MSEREDSEAAPPSRRWRIAVVEGPSRGAACELFAGKLTIGSAAENELVLADRTVSRRHLEIELLHTGPVVRDLDSKNGTYLADERIHIASLPRDGAALELGESRLEIRPLVTPAAGADTRDARETHEPAARPQDTPAAAPPGAVPPDTVEISHLRRRPKSEPAP